MKKRILRTIPALLLSLALCRLSGTAYAAVGTVNVSAGDDPRPGTNISFTITFTAEGDVAGVQGTVTASERLRFESAQCAQSFASASLSAGSFVLAGASRDAKGSVSVQYTYYVDWDTPQDTPVGIQVDDIILITGDGQRTKAAVVGITSAAATVKGQAVGTPSPTPTATATPTPTPTAKTTATPTPTPTATPTASASSEAGPTGAPTAGLTASPRATDTPGPEVTAGGDITAPSRTASAALPSAPAPSESQASFEPQETMAPPSADTGPDAGAAAPPAGKTQRTADGDRSAAVMGQLALLGTGAAAYGAAIYKKKK